MSQKIKPLNVSPLIRAARYISLISGIVYGMMKMGALKTYELTAKPRRDKMYKEQHIMQYEKSLREMRESFVDIVKQMDIPDVPPGWEKDLK